LTGSKNKLTAAGVILASVILVQACRTVKPAASNPAVPPPQTDRHCDPNYSPCVPIASDVDCAGGEGNGPAYVKGPVKVIGKDIYKLDGDHDGIGCE